MRHRRFDSSPVDLTKASYEELYEMLLSSGSDRHEITNTPDVLLVSVVVFMCLVFFNVMLGESTISYQIDSAPIVMMRDMKN